jgi:predicted DNA-binding transcriptional regulator AlpA
MKDYSSLLQLAKDCPGLQVSITLGELVEAIQYAIAETKRELEHEIADSKAETYISREKVMEITGKSSTTIWRWQKLNYLVPVSSVGGTYRYRMSDVRRIMEGGDPAAQEGDARLGDTAIVTIFFI